MSRGLAGHSMGGYGALKIGMKRPELFGSLYLMSSCCLGANRNPSPDSMKAAEAIKTREQAEEAAKAPGFGVSTTLAEAAAWSPNPANPPLFVVPGGPGADFRLLLPLRALADRYHVVMWDPRGAGLSERVTEAELTRDSFDDEIAAVHAALAPGRPVALVGHSEGAALVLRYAARHADAVAFVGLIEPAPITANARRHYHGGFPSFDAVEDFFWQNELLTSSDHAAADYKALTLVPNASAGFTCNGRPPPDDPMWRFGAFHHHVLTHGAAAPTGDFSWADGIDAYRGPLVLLAGSCGDAGASFQRAYNLPAIPRADVRVIEGAGHISLFIDYANATVDVLRTVLPAYGAGGRGQ